MTPLSGTHLLSLRRLLADGAGHLGRGCPLARASLQQVDPGGPRALVVLEVEEHVLVEREELLGPAAVLRGLLAEEAALGSLFTRRHRQIQSVALVVAHALLHFTFTDSPAFYVCLCFFRCQLQAAAGGITSHLTCRCAQRGGAGQAAVIRLHHGTESWRVRGASHSAAPQIGALMRAVETPAPSPRVHAPNFGRESPARSSPASGFLFC